MGWASYLEDIEERLADGLNRLGRLATDVGSGRINNADIYDFNRHITDWYNGAQAFMKELKDHVELAKIPEVELADEILKLKEENAKLLESRTRQKQRGDRWKAENEKSNQLIDKLEEERGKLLKDAKEDQDLIRQLTERNNEIRQQLEDIMDKLAKAERANRQLEAEKQELWETYADSIYEANLTSQPVQNYSYDDLKQRFDSNH